MHIVNVKRYFANLALDMLEIVLYYITVDGVQLPSNRLPQKGREGVQGSTRWGLGAVRHCPSHDPIPPPRIVLAKKTQQRFGAERNERQKGNLL